MEIRKRSHGSLRIYKRDQNKHATMLNIILIKFQWNNPKYNWVLVINWSNRMKIVQKYCHLR